MRLDLKKVGVGYKTISKKNLARSQQVQETIIRNERNVKIQSIILVWSSLQDPISWIEDGHRKGKMESLVYFNVSQWRTQVYQEQVKG